MFGRVLWWGRPKSLEYMSHVSLNERVFKIICWQFWNQTSFGIFGVTGIDLLKIYSQASNKILNAFMSSYWIFQKLKIYLSFPLFPSPPGLWLLLKNWNLRRVAIKLIIFHRKTPAYYSGEIFVWVFLFA